MSRRPSFFDLWPSPWSVRPSPKAARSTNKKDRGFTAGEKESDAARVGKTRFRGPNRRLPPIERGKDYGE